MRSLYALFNWSTTGTEAKTSRKVSQRQSQIRRRVLRRRFQLESLECRSMMAADVLISSTLATDSGPTSTQSIWGADCYLKSVDSLVASSLPAGTSSQQLWLPADAGARIGDWRVSA